jgi:hypothetical protein
MKRLRLLGKYTYKKGIEAFINYGCISSRQLKEFLNLNNTLVVEFTPHGDSAAKSSENRFTI